MTLSAKQIIADREEYVYLASSFREVSDLDLLFNNHHTRTGRLEALEDFFLSMQPRPIEEAPKDGEDILATDGDVWAVIFWEDGWIWAEGGRCDFFAPTHFIPLDALPLPEGE